MRYFVRVIAGPDAGKEVVWKDDHDLTIGSAVDNDLVLHDPRVSRVHCLLTAAPGGVRLKDLHSDQGTRVGGMRVEEGLIVREATLRLGDSLLVVSRLDGERDVPLAEVERFGPLLGRSGPMRELFALAERAAASDSVVLLEGERGTGKTLLAEAIHAAGARAAGPFVVIDCASFEPPLADRLEAARGGTVFLDEVADLPLDKQASLLRAFEPTAPARVIAASVRDLRREVEARRVRPALYHRLHVVRLRLPPLRERREDIALLAAHFHAEQGAADALPAEFLEHLCAQDWPGNVRELRVTIERLVALGGAALAAAIQFPRELDGPPSWDELEDPELSFRKAKHIGVARWEREYVRALLRRHGGRIRDAARAARMDPGYLRTLIMRAERGASRS